MNGKKLILSALGLALILILAACSQNEENAQVTSQVTYESDVKGVLQQNCLTCHGSDSPSLADFKADEEKYKGLMKGPRFDNYEELVVLVNGDDAGAFMRRLDDGTNKDDGKPGNMYNNLGKTEEERQERLATLKEWVGSWNLKHSEELTQEERVAITAVEK